MRKLTSLFLTSLLLASAAIPVHADEWRGHGDIHGFREHDFDHWRGGNWFHGPHGGRDGWWWVVGGVWYFYPQPVYPYPDPYTPPTMVVEPTPPGMAPAYVYYCQNPAGYYPYVPQCYGPWQRMAAAAPPVMAQPAPVMQAAPPMAAAPVLDQRKTDDRQLNAFAVEFQNINLHGKNARSKLSELAKRVEDFRQQLFQRSYNAMDILKDTENLAHRISVQRDKLSGHDAGAMNDSYGAGEPQAATGSPLPPTSPSPSAPPDWSTTTQR